MDQQVIHYTLEITSWPADDEIPAIPEKDRTAMKVMQLTKRVSCWNEIVRDRRVKEIYRVLLLEEQCDQDHLMETESHVQSSCLERARQACLLGQFA